MTATAAPDPQIAYDALAGAYDTLTAGYPYERWLPALEALAVRHGLRGRRLLDIGCGTGKSFMPLLERGYAITACDVSAAMLEHARQKAPGAHLAQADMRALPDLGRHDFVTCLDDSLNYMLVEDDLRAALQGVARSLVVDGVAIWDLNTLAMYRESFTGAWLAEADGQFVAWQGRTSPDLVAGDPASATVDIFGRRDDGRWHRTTSRHDQRHWPVDRVLHVAHRAGLDVVAVHGQRRGAVIEGDVDEHVHIKAVYAARRRDRDTRREVPVMSVGSP